MKTPKTGIATKGRRPAGRKRVKDDPKFTSANRSRDDEQRFVEPENRIGSMKH